MTELSNKEVLEQVIQKAIDGGWDYREFTYKDDLSAAGRIVSSIEGSMSSPPDYSIKDTIFDHDFCKALWGEEPWIAYQYHKTLERKDEDLIESGGRLLWQYHMQEMASSEDRIDYLRRNI